MKKSASLFLVAVIALSALVFSSGCKKVNEVDLAKYVQYTGFSGFASIEEKPVIDKYDETLEKLKKARKDAREDDDDDAYEEAKEKISDLKDLYKALSLVKFKLVKGENGKLANGDKIKIKAKYNSEKLEKYEVKFTADEFELKVKGLEEKEIIDAFAEDTFKPEYSGLDGDGSCYIKSYDVPEKNVTVYYSLDKSSDLSNGDTIKVTATIYDNNFMLKDGEDDGLTATTTITVAGLGEIPEKLDGVDTSAVDEKYLDKISGESKIAERLTDKGYAFRLYDEDLRYASLKILKASDIKVEKKIYGYKNSTDGKSMVYGIIYSQDVEVKVIDPSYSSKLKKGAETKSTAYYLAYMNSNLMVSDKKLVIRDEDYYYISTSLGFKSADDAIKDIKDYYSTYEFTTLEATEETTEPATEAATEAETVTETATEATTEIATESETQTATAATTESATKATEKTTEPSKKEKKTEKKTQKTTKKAKKAA